MSKITFFLFSFGLFLLTSCDRPSPPLSSYEWQLIAARDDGQSRERPLLYRVRVPFNWKRQDTSPDESIIDTTKSICEFYIEEEGQAIRVTIHTFPIAPHYPRISPQAQVTRWKSQFEEIDLVATIVTPDSHGGFHGLYFEGQGVIKGERAHVMGWSMQLATAYERKLNSEKEPFARYKRADYTIKASGPSDLIRKHRLSLLAFARSFELIDELPVPV